jgi:hypothetical protein
VIAEGVVFKGICDMGLEKLEPEFKLDPSKLKK